MHVRIFYLLPPPSHSHPDTSMLSALMRSTSGAGEMTNLVYLHPDNISMVRVITNYHPLLPHSTSFLLQPILSVRSSFPLNRLKLTFFMYTSTPRSSLTPPQFSVLTELPPHAELPDWYVGNTRAALTHMDRISFISHYHYHLLLC